MFNKLDELLKRKNQRFICRSGYPDPCPDEYVVYIEHVIDQKLTQLEIDQLHSNYRDFPELLTFYSEYGSLYLYTQIDEDETAFHITHPKQWGELDYFFKSWFKGLSETEKKEVVPEWLFNYIVIAEVPMSANYFILLLDGVHKGCVFEFCHDGYEFIKKGNNFEDFINGLCVVDESLINDLQYHTRYKDVRPASQWVVDEYKYD
jgi:hypothetical protein